jgi:hypothetical protein
VRIHEGGRETRNHPSTSGGNNENALTTCPRRVGSRFCVPVLAQEKNTVDPDVRQQIEAVHMKFDEACNKHDAAAVAALFTQDAVQVWQGWPGGAEASGQQAIEKRYAVDFESSPSIVADAGLYQLDGDAGRSPHDDCNRMGNPGGSQTDV